MSKMPVRIKLSLLTDEAKEKYKHMENDAWLELCSEEEAAARKYIARKLADFLALYSKPENRKETGSD